MKLKVCVITGSRAEYGLLYPLLKEMAEEKSFLIQLAVTGAHLIPEFGLTYKEIESDGFQIARKVRIPLSDDTDSGVTRSMGLAMMGFANAFETLNPDVVIVLGDRFETFAAVIAAFMARIPIAHLYGGELTEGALDDAFRHSITKMSMFHFVATEEYRNRVIQLGESPERVFTVGALGIDNIKHTELLSKDRLENELRFAFGKKTALVTYHPVTLEDGSGKRDMQALISALDSFKDIKIIFTKPNADTGRRVIEKAIDRYVEKNRKKAIAFASMGRIKYLSVVSYADVVIGNSSSGIIEVPALGRPAVNIGDRQCGRIKAPSVIDCMPVKKCIVKALSKALSPAFQKMARRARSPYGDGTAACNIVRILKNEFKKDVSIKKEFHTIEVPKFHDALSRGG